MERLPIELACYFEYCGVRPEEKWRLALHRVSVGPTSADDLVRYDGIHCLAINGLGMSQGWKANRDREEDNPKCGEEAKSSRLISWHTHHCANELPGGLLLRES